MKNVLIFIAGIVTGFILTIVISLGLSNSNLPENNDGKLLFEQEGECVSTNSFKIIQVLDSGDALAVELKSRYSYSLPTGITVLFLHEKGTAYYDDQVINIPRGKCAKQIGVFKYMSKQEMEKTVPIVDIR